MVNNNLGIIEHRVDYFDNSSDFDFSVLLVDGIG